MFDINKPFGGHDAINPPHYKDLNPEPIDVIEAWGLEKDYYIATVIKYLSRAGRKTPDPLEDLKKARWFLDRKIQKLEKQKLREEQQATQNSQGLIDTGQTFAEKVQAYSQVIGKIR